MMRPTMRLRKLFQIFAEGIFLVLENFVIFCLVFGLFGCFLSLKSILRQESGGPEDLNILLPELKLMKGASKNSNARMSATHRKRAGMRKKAYLYE